MPHFQFLDSSFCTLLVLWHMLDHHHILLFGTLIHNFHIATIHILYIVPIHKFHIDVTPDNVRIATIHNVRIALISHMRFGNLPGTGLLLPSPIKLFRRYIP